MAAFLTEAVPMSSLNNSILYIYKKGEVISFDSTNQKEKDGEKLTHIGTDNNLSSFCVESGGNYYYCVNQKIALENEEVSYLHHMEENYDVIVSSGDTLLLLKRFEKITLASKEPEKEKYEQTITLYGVGTQFDYPDGSHRDLIEEFEEKNNAGVDKIDDIETSQEAFLTNLMSGSDTYDIYRFWAVNEDSIGYIKNHAYTDLSSNKEIVEKLKLWYPSVAEGCIYNGEIIGIPCGGMMDLLYLNTEDYPELVEEDFSTWDSFLDVLEKYDKPLHFNKIRLETVLMEQYIATECDTMKEKYNFDNDTFRKTLQLMYRIEHMDIKYSKDDFSQRNFENKELLKFDNMDPYVETGQEFIPLPSINGESSVTPMIMGYNVINPNSDNKELSMKYMSLLAECGTYAMKDTAAQYPLLADIYENHAKCISGNFNDNGEVLEGYLNGTMSEDEAIEAMTEAIQRKLNQ